MEKWEPVYRTDDWYDGPREGFAELEGRHVIFSPGGIPRKAGGRVSDEVGNTWAIRTLAIP